MTNAFERAWMLPVDDYDACNEAHYLAATKEAFEGQWTTNINRVVLERQPHPRPRAGLHRERH